MASFLIPKAWLEFDIKKQRSELLNFIFIFI